MVRTWKGTKITVDLGSAKLHKALRLAAVERQASMRQIVIEALNEWLQRQEDIEDLQAFREAKGDETRPFAEFLAELGEESGIRSPHRAAG